MGSWSVRVKFHFIVIALGMMSPKAIFAQNVEYFGRYLIKKVQIVKKDLATTLPHEDLALLVRLENSRVILELADSNENEVSVYQLLRKEEIKSVSDDGKEILNGIKAFQNINGVIKHLVLTQEYLQITFFVPDSDIIRITHAKRSF